MKDLTLSQQFKLGVVLLGIIVFIMFLISMHNTAGERAEEVDTGAVVEREPGMLTEDEHRKLIERFGAGAFQLYASKLNDYIGQIGYNKARKYKSHYHTILNWIRRDREK